MKCKTCKINEVTRPKQTRCGKCLYEKQKKSPQYRIKQKVRRATRQAIKTGKLIKLNCFVCGNEESEAHHHDYSKPFDVVWLCRACHVHEHVKLRFEEFRRSLL